jgi:ketosteroid isomerase-like protein
MNHLAVVALLVLTVSCTPPAPPDTRAADEAAIRATDEAWSKAAEARDLNAVVSYYADDAQLLPPNAPLANTKESIRAGWAALLVPEMTVSWKVSKVEVARSGDLGYITGTYKIDMKPTGDVGKMVEVWKKQPDGTWKCVADSFNSDLPVPTPPPAQK